MVVTSWRARFGFDLPSWDVKSKWAWLAPRKFPISRYGRMARAAYSGAVDGSSSVYHSYSKAAKAAGESRVPRMKCRSAS